MVHRARGAAALALVMTSIAACGNGGGTSSGPARATTSSPAPRGSTTTGDAGTQAAKRRHHAQTRSSRSRLSAAAAVREHEVQLRTNLRCGGLAQRIRRRPTANDPRALAAYAHEALPIAQRVAVALGRGKPVTGRERSGVQQLRGTVQQLEGVYQRALSPQGHMPVAQVVAFEQRATFIARALQLPLCAPPWR